MNLLAAQICEELSGKSSISNGTASGILGILVLLCILDILVFLCILDILVLLCILDILVFLCVNTLAAPDI